MNMNSGIVYSCLELVDPKKTSKGYPKKANINPSLLRQYKTGKTVASEDQAKKVLKAIHQLGEELLSVSF